VLAKEYVGGADTISPIFKGGDKLVIARGIDFHLDEVLRPGSAAAPLTLYFVVEGARIYIVNVFLKLLKVLRMMGLLCLVES